MSRLRGRHLVSPREAKSDVDRTSDVASRGLKTGAERRCSRVGEAVSHRGTHGLGLTPEQHHGCHDPDEQAEEGELGEAAERR